jgi:hypothetical protein
VIVGRRLVVVVCVICGVGIFILVGFGREEGGVVAKQKRGFILNLKKSDMLGIIGLLCLFGSLFFVVETFSAFTCLVSIFVAVGTRVLGLCAVTLVVTLAFSFGILAMLALSTTLAFGVVVTVREVGLRTTPLSFAFPFVGSVSFGEGGVVGNSGALSPHKFSKLKVRVL